MILRHCINLLQDPETRGIDLESAEATEIHTRLIREKPALRKLYRGYYEQFVQIDQRAPVEGLRVEVGSGGGFLKEMVPGLITVDVRPGARVDVVASALELPFETGSVSSLFMLNVLHHLPDANRFFDELLRVLAPGGRCGLIEPYVSPLSRLIYTRLHHEPFDPDQSGWELDGFGAMTSANDALPWIIFSRDRSVFEARFPTLSLEQLRPHTIFSYLVSGGLSYRSLVPGFAFDRALEIDSALSPLGDLMASMMTVELKRL